MIFGKKERAICHILVVEDEPLVAFDNEYQLKDAGYEVVGTTDSAEEARRMISEAEALDLVMADINLSDGTGIEVAEAARERGVAVLFVTGNCPDEYRHLAIGCLSKPYSSKVLKNALDAIDTVMRAEDVKKVPEQLTIFGVEGV